MPVSLVTPSTSVATSSPKRSRTSSSDALVSSTVSCSSAAHSVSVSRRMPAQIFATPTGWTMKSSPDLRRWSAWCSHEKRKASSTRSRSISTAASSACSSTIAKRSPSSRRSVVGELGAEHRRRARRGARRDRPARARRARARRCAAPPRRRPRAGRCAARWPCPEGTPCGQRVLPAFGRAVRAPARAALRAARAERASPALGQARRCRRGRPPSARARCGVPGASVTARPSTRTSPSSSSTRRARPAAAGEGAAATASGSAPSRRARYSAAAAGRRS